jgi:hypothetical protein
MCPTAGQPNRRMAECCFFVTARHVRLASAHFFWLWKSVEGCFGVEKLTFGALDISFTLAKRMHEKGQLHACLL